MNNYAEQETLRLQQRLSDSCLANFAEELLAYNQQGWHKILKHGDLKRWKSGFHALPDNTPSHIHCHSAAIQIGCAEDTNISQHDIKLALQQMHPWRKGPFNIFGVDIDTEWRSDWKWDRLKDAISPLHDRTVLDIGCGSGYHLWRMLGAGCKLALGIDPTPLFSMHFATIKRYQIDSPAFMLPIGIEHMPSNMKAFDSVFSMGILYHRKSPMDHLIALRQLLKPGGELILDTLIIEGDVRTCLMPQDRYAKMRNVWFIPSVEMLQLWLERTGFHTIRVIDVHPTSTDEQRATEWMRFESLADFLDPNDSSRSIEGYPAPSRAILTAQA